MNHGAGCRTQPSPTAATGRPRRALALRGAFLCLCALLAGCGRHEEARVRLVLISPHRDEIREECARAFTDWFRARSEDRARAAADGLAQWLKSAAADDLTATRHAFADLFHDWAAGDLPEVSAAYRAWDAQPTADHGAALAQALEAWRTNLPGVDIVWQDIGGGTSQIARYVAARYEANPEGIGIDVLFGGGTDIFLRFAGQGLLEKLTFPKSLLQDRIRPQLNGIPLYDPDGRWFGPVLSSFGILYNKEVLRRIGQPEPRRWDDLGQPGLYSWVSAGDPRLTGSLHMVYEIILQGKGWDDGFRLLLRLGANTHTFIRDSGTLTRTVNSAEVAAAGTLDAMALPSVGRDPEVMGFRLTEGETIINPDAIAVLKNPPRKELARAFVEFTLSDAGQLIFLLQPGQAGGPRRYPLCRLSVVEDLYRRYPPAVRSVGDANPFAVKNTISYDSRLGNNRWDGLNDLFGAVILEAHPDLRAAWGAVLRLPEDPDRRRLEAELFAPFCSKDELLGYAKRIPDESPRFRAERINRWGEEARERYRRIKREAKKMLATEGTEHTENTLRKLKEGTPHSWPLLRFLCALCVLCG